MLSKFGMIMIGSIKNEAHAKMYYFEYRNINPVNFCNIMYELISLVIQTIKRVIEITINTYMC